MVQDVAQLASLACGRCVTGTAGLLDGPLGEGGRPHGFNSTRRVFASFDSNYIPDVSVLATLRDSDQLSKL